MTNTNPRAADTCTDPKCGAPLAEHIGGKSCVVGTAPKRDNLYDLTIFGRMWREDGRQISA